MKMSGNILLILSALTVMLLSGCSGGVGSDTATKTVSGVAATGAAINGTVCLRDAASHESCVITSNGIYSFDVTTMTPPFILRASWSENGVPKELYSMAVRSGVANISPLTHAIVIEAAGGDVAGVYDTPTPSALIAMADNIPEATIDFQNALAPLILQYASTNTDPITTPYLVNHTGMDSLLDNTSFSFANNTMTVTNSVTGSVLYQAPATSIDQGVSTILWSSTEGKIAEDPSVAVDSSGNGLVLWVQNDNTRYNIESKWLYGSRGSARVSDGTTSCIAPKVAFAPDGTAHAVWYQATEGGLTTIWHSRYVPGTGWTGRTQVSQHTTSAYYPQLAVDGSGNVMAIWYEAKPPVGNHFEVYASRYSSQSGIWSTPVQLSSSSHSAYRPMVAMNTAGKAVAVWPEDIGDGSVSNDDKEVVAASWNGTTWSAPIKLNSISGVSQSIYAQVAVAIDDNGDAMALWPQNTIQAARLVNGAWGASADITNGGAGICYAPEVAFSSSGKAIAVWQQHDGSNKYDVATNSFSSNTGWGTASIISMGTDSAEYPHLAIDSSGNATVVWAEGFYSSTAPAMMQSLYLTGIGWSPPLSIATLTSDDLYYSPVTAVGSNPAGQVYSVWGLDSM